MTLLVVEDHAGESRVEKFLEQLAKDDRAEAARLNDRLERLAEHGLPRNDEIWKHLWGAVWEIKTRKVRIICWLHGNDVVLIEGFRKKRDRIPPGVKQRVERIINELSNQFSL